MSDNAKRAGHATLLEFDQRLKRLDEPRWLATRYTTDEKRAGLVALYFLHLELGRCTRMSEPTLGLIRLEWWRETLDVSHSSDPSTKHELLPLLTAAFGKTAPGLRQLLPMVEAWSAKLSNASERQLDPGATLAGIAARFLKPTVSENDLRRIQSIASDAPDRTDLDDGRGIAGDLWPAFVHVVASNDSGTGLELKNRWRVFRAMWSKHLI